MSEDEKIIRLSIRAWTKAGLPYLEADRGRPAGYHIGHVMWWFTGMEYFKAMEHSGNVTALEIIMFS
ncbi:hypothetical protein S829_23225 [Salmonella enterica]|nr:hypothetical protein [Salmonella enterica]ECH8375654.1 hypothetical protein [Salmonella enterica subsp. enterica]EDW6357167.1 hypothetical protein [Salmonella enterica subsp. enterica serovar Sandiego]EAW0864704.1 hypothetical protein [Salmonella enterica]EAX2424530.1 hypothetical protein [Salmonella enterica]